MNSKAGKTLVLAVLSAFAVAGTANATPNRETSLGKANNKFAWTTDTQTAITGQFWWIGDPDGDCGTFDFTGATQVMDYCDQTLVHVTNDGVLSAALPAGDENTNDWNVYIFKSDSGGAATDTDQLAAGESAGGAEQISTDVTRGYYLVVTVPMTVVNSSTAASVSWAEPAPADDE